MASKQKAHKKTKKVQSRKGASAKRTAKARKAKGAPEERFRDAWQRAVEALHTAQVEAEQQLAQALKKNRFHAREVRDGVRTFRKRFEKERKRLSREMEEQIDTLEDRVTLERKAISSAIDTGMRSALAALNIPSRKEISDLTRKVETLSRKIDRLQR